MGFSKMLREDILSEGFGNAQYIINSKERKNLSKAKIDSVDSGIYIKADNESTTLRYGDNSSWRYIVALNITYDLLVSIYDPVAADIMVFRSFDMTSAGIVRLRGKLYSFKKDHGKMEVRIMGMQSGQSSYWMNDFVDFVEDEKLELVEVDLFGKQIRNIAVDSKIGLDFNILTQSRLYKPGELTNNISFEQFKEASSAQTTTTPDHNSSKV